MSVRVISTPIGLLRLSGTDEALREVRLIDVPEPEVCPEALERTALELGEYFSGRRTAFTVTPAPRGTAFQRAVWRELTAVPYGQTLTYGALAARIGRPGSESLPDRDPLPSGAGKNRPRRLRLRPRAEKDAAGHRGRRSSARHRGRSKTQGTVLCVILLGCGSKDFRLRVPGCDLLAPGVTHRTVPCVGVPSQAASPLLIVFFNSPN